MLTWGTSGGVGGLGEGGKETKSQAGCPVGSAPKKVFGTPSPPRGTPLLTPPTTFTQVPSPPPAGGGALNEEGWHSSRATTCTTPAAATATIIANAPTDNAKVMPILCI